jgi:mycofactocin glycosyltransferase
VPLLPEELKALWRGVDEGRRTREEATAEQARLVGERRRVWSDALIEKGARSLQESLLRELGAYLGIADLAVVEERCKRSLETLREEWVGGVDTADRASVEGYYRRSDGTLYELLWWHTLVDDDSPLAYVNALELAQPNEGRSHLDFGSGIGSGGLLFARAGFAATLADISLPLLAFARWRFARRGIPARFVDTGTELLGDAAFDVITAMDVFEHLANPVEVLETLWRALKPGGLLFARLDAAPDPERPQHIVFDFSPVFRRIEELGFVPVWQDDWLWGHRAFRKTG